MNLFPKLLLAFYGDDFTGSTDAMEALTLAGLRTVLFLSPPSPALLRDKFTDLRCLGVAGSSRAMSPNEMDFELRPMLDELWSVGAPLLHYKVCSTFDSSPSVGNIGHVADMARMRFTQDKVISVLAGAPPLGRYTVFGNHFASAGDEVHRLDRHPTMSRHPVTPMDEADLRLHLARQTKARLALMSLIDLAGSSVEVDARYARKLQGGTELLLYDALDDESLRTAGRLIWQEAQRGRHFAIGSSGVEYALSAHWRASGVIDSQRPVLPPVRSVEQVLVVSGSASPLTAKQIGWASENGFDTIRAPTERIVRSDSSNRAFEELSERALGSIKNGRSVIIYSAYGPEDSSIAATRACMESDAQAPIGNTAKVLGTAMGRIAHEVLMQSNLRRVVIAGGDTSSYATRELQLYALEMLAELSPGAPLCRGYSHHPRFDGLEIALKGGQMGKENYFGLARGWTA